MAFQIDSEFPGGNVVVENIDGSEVRLHQDLRDTPHDWFYWCFRVRGAEGRALCFTFTRSRALGVRGPAISFDGGDAWAWLGSDVVNGSSFSYAFPEDALDVRLSFAMPYQEAHWLRFADGVGDNPAVSRRSLCTTAKGRGVDYMLLSCQEARPQHRVVITCRHHSCEMMANYTLEGLIDWVLTDSGAEAQWLRENAEFLLVPFVDKDGVEDGDQGKGRWPRDYGRDYEGHSAYPPTEAIRRLLPDWGDGRLRIGLDLHCPHITGSHNEVIYLVGSPHDRLAAEQRRFSEILEGVAKGPLPFHASDFLPFGIAWNKVENYVGGKSISSWIAELPEVVLGATIEIPYANAGGDEVNQESARAFGPDLGMALATYLQTIRGNGHGNKGEATR